MRAEKSLITSVIMLRRPFSHSTAEIAQTTRHAAKEKKKGDSNGKIASTTFVKQEA